MPRRQTTHCVEYCWPIKWLLNENVEQFPTFISSPTFGLQGTSTEFCLQATLNDFFDKKGKSRFFLRLRKVSDLFREEVEYLIRIELEDNTVICKSQLKKQNFCDEIGVCFPILELKHDVLQKYLQGEKRSTADRLIVCCKIKWQYRPDPRDKEPAPEPEIILSRTKLTAHNDVPGALTKFGNAEEIFNQNNYHWHFNLDEARQGSNRTVHPIWKHFVRVVRRNIVYCIVHDCSQKLRYRENSIARYVSHLRKHHKKEYRRYLTLVKSINRGTRNYSSGSESEELEQDNLEEADLLSLSDSSDSDTNEAREKRRRKALKRRKRQSVSKQGNAAPKTQNNGVSVDLSKKSTNLKRRRRTKSDVSYSMSDSDQPSTSHQKRKKSTKERSPMPSYSADQPSTSHHYEKHKKSYREKSPASHKSSADQSPKASKRKPSEKYRHCVIDSSDDESPPRPVKRSSTSRNESQIYNLNTSADIWSIPREQNNESETSDQTEDSPTPFDSQPPVQPVEPEVNNQNQLIPEPFSDISDDENPADENQNPQQSVTFNMYSDITSASDQFENDMQENQQMENEPMENEQMENEPNENQQMENEPMENEPNENEPNQKYPNAKRYQRLFSSTDEDEIEAYRNQPEIHNFVRESYNDSNSDDNLSNDSHELDNENLGRDDQSINALFEDIEGNQIGQEAQQNDNQHIREQQSDNDCQMVEESLSQQNDEEATNKQNLDQRIEALFDSEYQMVDAPLNQQNQVPENMAEPSLNDEIETNSMDQEEVEQIEPQNASVTPPIDEQVQQNEEQNGDPRTLNNQESVENDHDFRLPNAKEIVLSDDECSDSSSIIALDKDGNEIKIRNEEDIEVITVGSDDDEFDPSNSQNEPTEEQQNNEVEPLNDLVDSEEEESNLHIIEPYKRETVTDPPSTNNPSTSQIVDLEPPPANDSVDSEGEESNLRIVEHYKREQVTDLPPSTNEPSTVPIVDLEAPPPPNDSADSDEEESNLRIVEHYKREQVTDLPPANNSNDEIVIDQQSSNSPIQNEPTVNSPYGIDQLRISSTTPTYDDSNNGPSINICVLDNPGFVLPMSPINQLTSLNEKASSPISIQMDPNDKSSQSEPVSPISQSSDESIDDLVRRVKQKYASNQNLSKTNNDTGPQSDQVPSTESHNQFDDYQQQQNFNQHHQQQVPKTLTDKELFNLKNALAFLLCEFQIPTEQVENPHFMSDVRNINPNLNGDVSVAEIDQIISSILCKINNSVLQALSKVKKFTLLINALSFDSTNQVLLFFSIGYQCGKKTEVIFLSVKQFMMQLGQQKQQIKHIVEEVLRHFNLQFDQLLGTTILSFDNFLVENDFSPYLIYSHHNFIQRAINEVVASDNTYLSAKFSLKMIIDQFCKKETALKEFQHLTGVNSDLKRMEFEQLSACLLKNRHYFMNLCRKWFPETEIKLMSEREWSILSEIQRLQDFCKCQMRPIVQNKHITVGDVLPLVKKFLLDLRMNFKLYLNDLPANLANKLEEIINFAFNQNSPNFNPVYLKATLLNNELSKHLTTDQLNFSKRSLEFELKKEYKYGSWKKCRELVNSYINNVSLSHARYPFLKDIAEVNLGYDSMAYWENFTEKFTELAEIAKRTLPIIATPLHSNDWFKMGLVNWIRYSNLDNLLILERNFFIHLNKHLT